MGRLIMIIWLMLGLMMSTYANEKPLEVVRVGFPYVKNFSEIDAKGNPTGYMYEYLSEIQKYTGWKYEYIEGEIPELMNQLQKGEIDIIGGIFYSEELTQEFEISSSAIGSTYNVILTHKNNDKPIYEYEKIGVLKEDRVGTNELKNYCEAREFNFKIMTYNTSEDLMQAFESDQIDGILTDRLHIRHDQKIIAEVDKRQYYLATTKGNTDLIENINKAITYIEKNNPNIKNILYTKYFFLNNYPLNINEEEEAYLQQHSPIVVGYIENSEPYSYYNKKMREVQGISVDVLKLIGDILGINFKFIPIETLNKGIEALESQKIELFISNMDTKLLDKKGGYKISNTYLKVPIRKIKNKQGESRDLLILPKYYDMLKIEEIEEDVERIVNKGDIIQIVNWINRNASSYSFTDSHTAMSINNIKYPHIIFKPTKYVMEFSYWINQESEMLLQVINEAINHLPEEEVDDIVYRYISNKDREMTIEQLIYNYASQVILVVSIVTTIVIALVINYFRLKLKYEKDINRLLKESAEKDYLTQVYNRKTFEEKVEQYLNKRGVYKKMALAIIDIDYFKQVNDTLGHLQGDKVLELLGRELLSQFKDDFVCRWGGDEFIVFIKYYDEATYEKLQQLLRYMNRKLTNSDGSQQVQVSLSIGITCFEGAKNKSDTLTQLYEQADYALYRVKEKGRNNIFIYNDLKR